MVSQARSKKMSGLGNRGRSLVGVRLLASIQVSENFLITDGWLSRCGAAVQPWTFM
jgi:hypothetical protein